MKILGIDPGIARMGWGIIEVKSSIRSASSGQEFRVKNYGCFETSSDLKTEERLKLIFEFLQKIIKEHAPDAMSIEELFFNTNAKTAMVVGQARGVVMLASNLQQLQLATYTPLQVKIALTGYGRAEKSQVGHMVKVILGLSQIPKPDDTSDALAVAITHAFSYKINSRYK